MMPRMFANLPHARRLVFGTVLLLAAAARAASLPPPEPVRELDLTRYLGRWYVIAERPPAQGVASYVEYRRRDDGRIDDLYVARDSFAAAPETSERVAQPDPERPARWEVRAGWLTSEERLVLYVSADYRHAIVGDPQREAAWILAREPQIAEWIYAGLLARLAMQGYDVSDLRRVPQKEGPAYAGPEHVAHSREERN